jgi:cathepsin L
MIKEHNKETGHTFTVGHNKMSDWSEEEYEAILTFKEKEIQSEHIANESPILSYSPIDWRIQPNSNGDNCMWAILDQGQCGACWAFSTQASMGANTCIMMDGYLQNFSV